MADEITTLGGGESAPAAEPTAPTAAPSWTEQLPKDHREFASGYEDAPAFAKAFLSKSGAGWEEIDGDPQPWTEQLPKHLRKLKALNDHENLPALAEAFSGLNGEQDPGATEQDPGEKDGKAEPEKAEKPAKRLKGERALFKRLAEIDFQNDPPEVIAAEVDRFNEFIDQARGVPGSPEDYQVPQEAVDYFESMGSDVPAIVEEAKPLARELGLTQDQYAGLVEALAWKQGETHRQQYEQRQLEEATLKREVGKLREEIGADRFEPMVKYTEHFMEQSMPPPLFKAMQDRGDFADVRFMRWAMTVASEFMEDRIVAGSGPQERNVSPGQQAATAEQRKYRAVYGNSMG